VPLLRRQIVGGGGEIAHYVSTSEILFLENEHDGRCRAPSDVPHLRCEIRGGGGEIGFYLSILKF